MVLGILVHSNDYMSFVDFLLLFKIEILVRLGCFEVKMLVGP